MSNTKPTDPQRPAAPDADLNKTVEQQSPVYSLSWDDNTGKTVAAPPPVPQNQNNQATMIGAPAPVLPKAVHQRMVAPKPPNWDDGGTKQAAAAPPPIPGARKTAGWGGETPPATPAVAPRTTLPQGGGGPSQTAARAATPAPAPPAAPAPAATPTAAPVEEPPVATSQTFAPSAPSAATNAFNRAHAVPDDPVGTVFADRYRIISKLGEGGMGVVYLAEHVIIEKRVALKVLSEDFARKADLVQRFMQEAKAASRIGHENIVDITDFGETPSGSVFFAMEFLDGKDLANHIRDGGQMQFQRARVIVTQICRALGAAHAKGIIHRDMKPENIFLIEREGRADFVKILDFGIAKMSALDSDGGGARLTRTGMIFGTPEYMSPEQARGDRPDHRVDIYAVGCILYEMLTGDVPFRAETFMGVLTKHMFETAEPISKRAPNVPADVEAVVMRALAKDREQRFQTMKEMSLALAACGGMVAAEGWGDEPSMVASGPIDPSLPGFGMVRMTGVGSAVMPVADPSGRIPLPSAEESRALKRSSNAGIVIGVLLFLLAAGGGGLYFYMHSRERPVAPPPVAPLAAVAAPKAVDRPPPPTGPIRITIKSTPTGADVYVTGTLKGQTPCDVSYPRGDAPIVLTLKKKDYKDFDNPVVPSKDYDLELTLEPAPKGSSPAKPHSGHGTADHHGQGSHGLPQAPPIPSSPPAGTKPTGTKLRDLKDPFSGTN